MKKKHTIGTVTAGLMIAFALVFDGIQALLTVSVFLLPFSIFVTFFSVIGFSIWFALLGISYSGRFGAARILTMIATAVAELAPIINALPAITAGVIGLIVLSRFEDMKQSLIPQGPTAAEVRHARLAQARAIRTAQLREEREQAATARFVAANDTEPEEDERTAA